MANRSGGDFLVAGGAVKWGQADPGAVQERANTALGPARTICEITRTGLAACGLRVDVVTGGPDGTATVVVCGHCTNLDAVQMGAERVARAASMPAENASTAAARVTHFEGVTGVPNGAYIGSKDLAALLGLDPATGGVNRPLGAISWQIQTVFTPSPASLWPGDRRRIERFAPYKDMLLSGKRHDLPPDAQQEYYLNLNDPMRLKQLLTDEGMLGSVSNLGPKGIQMLKDIYNRLVEVGLVEPPAQDKE